MKLGLLLLIGLPGSGKTTLAISLKQAVNDTEENLYQFIHVCYDDLISFTNHIQEQEWKFSRASVAAKVENLVVSIKNRNINTCPAEFINAFKSKNDSKSNIVLILDDNFYFKSMRYTFFQMARKHNISFCQVFVNCSLESALLKNSARETSHIIPSHIIQNMFCKIEPPNVDNYWERFSIEIDAFCDINKFYDKLFPVLNNSLDNFEYVKEKDDKDSVQCNTNVIHQTDIALRTLVGLQIKNFLTENSNKEAKKYSAELSKRKSEILSDIKAGVISLPEEIFREMIEVDSDKSQMINFLIKYF